MKTPSQSALQSILNFARSHDWGRHAFIDSGSVWFYDPCEHCMMSVRSMAQLRAWAGY